MPRIAKNNGNKTKNLETEIECEKGKNKRKGSARGGGRRGGQCHNFFYWQHSASEHYEILSNKAKAKNQKNEENKRERKKVFNLKCVIQRTYECVSVCVCTYVCSAAVQNSSRKR